MIIITYRLSDGAVCSLSTCQVVDQVRFDPEIYGILEVFQEDISSQTHRVVNGELVEYTQAQKELASQFQPPHMRWDVQNCLWVDTRNLAQLKADKWEEIKLAREAAFDAPLTTPYGVFDSDPKSRKNITDTVLLLQTLDSAGTPGTVDYTLYDNTTVTLDLEKIITVGLLLGQKTQVAMARGRVARAAIDAATTIAEVQAVEW